MQIVRLLMTFFVGWAFLVSAVHCQETATAVDDSEPAQIEIPEAAVGDSAGSSIESESETHQEVIDLDDTTTDSGPGESVPNDEQETNEEPSTEGVQAKEEDQAKMEEPPVQSGPFVDLFGPKLLSLDMIDETTAQLKEELTNDALRGKKVVGVYFSADWCGPCRQFTPELVSFYNKMNARRGKKDNFEIVWVSRCRDVNSFAQYFTHMNWVALPPEEAMGERGQSLSNRYKVKGIPTLVLLDDLGHVITTDARNKIPQDKAGIGFPWRSPVASILSIVFPRTLRAMVKSQLDTVRTKLVQKVKTIVGLGAKPAAAEKS